MKHKKIDLYLFNTDIEILNKRYSELYKQVKNDENITSEQMNRACEVLLAKYNFEIEDLCKFREPEYWEQQAKIAAKDKEQTPWRRCWLWRLLFQPLTNRAQDIIEEEAALDAEERFTPLEKELERRATKLYPTAGQPRHWWQRIIHKKQKSKPEQPDFVLIGATVPGPETPSEPFNAAQQLEKIIEQADEAAPEEAFEQPEPPTPPIRKPRKTKQAGVNTP